MADYFPLLSRAVTGKNAEEREAIYLRARAALDRQLHGFDPPLEEISIKAELDALEAVIITVERDVLEAEAAAAPAPALASASPVDLTEAAGPAGPAEGAQPAQPDKGTDEADRTHVDTRSDLELSTAPLAPDVKTQASDHPAREDRTRPLPEAAPDESEPSPQETIDETPAIRPSLRPRVPVRDEAARPNKRVALFAGLAMVAMLIMGLLALSQRDQPGRLQAPAAPPTAAAPSTDEGEGPKTEGRLAGGEPAPRAPETQPVPQPPRPAEPQRQASVEPPRANGTVETPASTTSRAFMVLESASGSPSQFEGLSAWSFAPDPALRGLKSLKTIVAFPQANLTIDIGFARNSDPAVNASHTIMVVFDSGGAMESIREMSPIEWRERETQSGQVLAGIVVPVQDNVFMIGLDRAGGATQRNLDILRAQRWMVFEIRLANGRRGAVLIEKGAPGDKAVAEALAEWR